MKRLLDVNGLKTYFFTRDGKVPAVDGISFYIDKGETIGLVGESGSGKSITALSILQLVQRPGKILDGHVDFDGENLLEKDHKEMRKIRGNRISMIFQEPMTSLNPVFTIGSQITEVLRLHQGLSEKKAREKAIEMLKVVGIPLAEKRIKEYPHQLSGGMRQRAMIAMALSCNPKLLIADEPTTALDVTIQAQILDKIHELKKINKASVLMITHDLGVIAEICDRVYVMYAGKIIEHADVLSLFTNPLHPYTLGLLSSIPRLDTPKTWLPVIEGCVPRPTDFPKGCRFHPRCAKRANYQGLCEKYAPPLRSCGQREVACWQYFSHDEIGRYVDDLNGDEKDPIKEVEKGERAPAGGGGKNNDSFR